jgi:thiol-disulfide isomerase/thioredoxin
MLTSLAALFSLPLLFPNPVRIVSDTTAPTVATASTPEECSKAVRAETSSYYKSLEQGSEKLSEPEMNKRYEAKQLELNQSCAKRFANAALNAPQLRVLVEIQLEAKMVTEARATAAKAVSAASGESERAMALVTALNTVTIEPADSGKIHEYVKQIDALSVASAPEKVRAHLSLLHSTDNIDQQIVEAEKAIAAVEQMPKEVRDTVNSLQLTDPYRMAAGRLARKGENEKARGVAARVKEILPAAKLFHGMIDNTVNLYGLKGGQAPSITATDWFNAPEGTKDLALKGPVTLIEFTAHWCGPCRATYPAIAKLHEKYAKQGLQVAFLTQMYGYFKDKKDLAAQEELAADKDYWLGEHKMQFKIGVDITPLVPDTMDKSGKATKYAKSGNFQRYFVFGIPTLILIDRTGTVRHISMGGSDLETVLGKEIEKLLAEGTSGTK